MILISKLSGGIGNQLFQYLFGKSLAQKFNARLYVDLSSFIGYGYHHDFELKKIVHDLEIAVNEMTNEKKGTYYLHELDVVSIENLVVPLDCEIIVLSGYWQNEKYFNIDVVNQLYGKFGEIFKQKSREVINKAEISSSVAVHVRRRDYKHMGLCSEEYYIASIQYLRSLNSNIKIYLFSDEPNYSSHFLNLFFPGEINIIKTGDDLLDLYIMSCCDNIIMSNSTFSWWGAYFGEKNKKIIINPEPWILLDDKVRPCPERWKAVKGAVKFNVVDKILIDNHVRNLGI